MHEQPKRARMKTGLTECDLDRAENGFREILEAFKLDLSSEELQKTPRRAALAYASILVPEPFQASTFPNTHHYHGWVLARSIPFHSICEHHLLPFFGQAHLGYLPDERIIGLSALTHLVQHFSRQPQVQERLTTQISGWLEAELKPRGVGLILEAEHLCMSLRGVKAPGVKTITSAFSGEGKEKQQEFLNLVQ